MSARGLEALAAAILLEAIHAKTLWACNCDGCRRDALIRWIPRGRYLGKPFSADRHVARDWLLERGYIEAPA